MSEVTDIPKGYKQTKVGVIPEDWKVNTVGKALLIENNKRKPISELERRKIQGSYPYYGPTKIQDYINEYQYDGEYALIAEDGDHFLKYRDQSMTQLASGKFNVNNHAHSLKGTEECLTKWFYWFYNRRNIYSHITRQGAGRYKLNKAALEQLHIAYTNVSEQLEIIKTLETWDKSISTTQSIIDELKIRNKGLAQQLLTGNKRLEGFTDSWKNLRLGDVTEKFSLRNKTLINARVYSVTNYSGFVLQSEHFSREVAGDDLTSYKIISKGEFAYNPARINVGSIAYFNKEEKGVISSLYVCFRTNDLVIDKFISHWIGLDKTHHDFGRYGEGGVRIYLWYDLFAKIKIEIPPLKEQEAIIQILDQGESELKLYKKKLITLKEQKKGLMQKLLTGEIRVKINEQ